MGWLVALMALAIPGIYLFMEAKQVVAVDLATHQQMIGDQKACNAQIGDLAEKLNSEADQRVADARSAAAAVKPTPSDKAGLDALCKASASCRDNKKVMP